MIELPEGAGLADILAAREDSMTACRRAPWLERFVDIPDDASAPLAMSPLHPRAVGSYGEQHFDWAKRELGVTYRWWQQLAIARQLEHDEDGALVYPEVIETGPRRIGKSVRLRGVSCWRTDSAPLIGEKQLSMLVSKDLAVGKEIHRGSWRWAEQRDWKVTRLNGAQEIEKPEDESRWLLRADTAVYGYDVSYGPVDEAWGVDPQSITDGLEPAMLERLWPQLHLTSTAHVKATSLMRRRLVAALRNADPNVLLLFWGAHPSADLADPRTWRAASPHWTPQREALIRRKYAAALAGEAEPEFDDPDPVRGWAAQYLNVWPNLLATAATKLVMPRWHQQKTTTPPSAPAALGIAVDLDRIWVSVAAASSDSTPHVGPATVMRNGEPLVLRLRLDTDLVLVVTEVARIQRETGCAVTLDQGGQAGSLTKSLTDAGVTLTPAGLDDVCTGSVGMHDAIESGNAVHGGYPALDDAVLAATWRKVGRRKAWGAAGGDISMLEAASLALGAVQHKTTRIPMAAYA
ncbi:hypothetical protein ACIRN4_16440 [Pimelobacter simplex]|uniref:hypothetical protein n=1 Tax=Nocardioides simplex TaxID=2045 RepID=UPI00380CF00B